MKTHIRFILLILALCSGGSTHAQCHLEGGTMPLFSQDIQLAGCNMTSYFNLYRHLRSTDATVLTPTPDGYEPFYVSTYARHGSRYLTEAYQYDDPIAFLRKAAARGALTAQGLQVYDELKRVRAFSPKEKIGALTPIGAAQHRDIARRLCANFPEIFNPQGHFYAQSSVVKRCVGSMKAQCEVIDSVIGRPVTLVSGLKGMQDRIAGHYNDDTMEKHRGPGYALHSRERQSLTPYRRLCAQFLKNPAQTPVKEQKAFARQLFMVADNMQSHSSDIDLWKYFTPAEADSLYAISNRHWYRMFGPSPVTGGMMPLRSKWQLEDFIQDADSIVGRTDWHGANLRFGHDTALMPLVCLMELGTTGRQVPETEIASLTTFWRNHEIFPMAGNIQLIFYRPLSGQGDVLVKALLNEREVTLPATPVSGPYYRWTDVRAHWAERIGR